MNWDETRLAGGRLEALKLESQTLSGGIALNNPPRVDFVVK